MFNCCLPLFIQKTLNGHSNRGNKPTASRSRSLSMRSASWCSILPRLDASILRHGEPLCAAARAASTALSTSSYRGKHAAWRGAMSSHARLSSKISINVLRSYAKSNQCFFGKIDDLLPVFIKLAEEVRWVVSSHLDIKSNASYWQNIFIAIKLYYITQCLTLISKCIYIKIG